MTTAILLLEGKNLKNESLSISLMNAKQLVIGNAPEFGWILHVAGNSPDDIGQAIVDFAKIKGVTRLTTLAVRNQ